MPRSRSPLAGVVSAIRRNLARLEARLGRRGLLAVGAGSAAIAVLLLFLVFRGGPATGPGPSSPGASGGVAGASRTPTEEPVFDLLPTPSTTDVVLLVGSKDALTATEQQWLSDLRASLGNVDPLPYRDATLDALRAYLVVFVIDESADLDPAVLAEAYGAGLTVHLVGRAAGYADTVKAGAAAEPTP